MDYEVIWTDEALCDVEEIAKYIEKDSFFYASSVVTKIIDTTRLYLRTPNTDSFGSSFAKAKTLLLFRRRIL